jgi:hypothetical protein
MRGRARAVIGGADHQPANMLRPGGRMVHRLPGSIEPALECGAVVAQIAQDAGKSGLNFCGEYRANVNACESHPEIAGRPP